MNAQIDQKTLLKQADDEFRLIDERPESIQVEEALKNKWLLQLGVAEELMLIINEGGSIEDIRHNPDSIYSVKDRLEWDIKRDFLTNLKKGGAVTEVSLQTIINTLALEIKKEGIVRLVPDSFVYLAQSASLKWGDKFVIFKASRNSHYFLEFMFNNVKRGVLVDKDELFENVFGKELSLGVMGQQNSERNKQVKSLNNVMVTINHRIQSEFQTVDRLFSSETGGYVRNF